MCCALIKLFYFEAMDINAGLVCNAWKIMLSVNCNQLNIVVLKDMKSIIPNVLGSLASSHRIRFSNVMSNVELTVANLDWD